MTTSTQALTLEQLYIQYAHQQTVIHGISLVVNEGEIACLLGPSGCGKTTLLRAIAGFEPVQAGCISLQARVISSPSVHIPTEKRSIGMVFQDYALFPHLSIAANIAFGIRRLPKKVQRQRVTELLKLVNLPDYGQRYPHELSGGQQQRIALARALAPRPHLLLLDEPFGSQDVELREMLAREVRSILKREGTTAILVTHDQQEAFAMADQIGVLQHGRLCQWGTGYELYHQPIDTFVAEFIGQGTLLPGTLSIEHSVTTVLGTLTGLLTPSTQATQSAVNVLIRPDDVRIHNAGAYSATVVSRIFRGAAYLYTLELVDGSRLIALARSHPTYALGEAITFDLDRTHFVVLPRDEPSNALQ